MEVKQIKVKELSENRVEKPVLSIKKMRGQSLVQWQIHGHGPCPLQVEGPILRSIIPALRLLVVL
jgi:hypothetical protein